MSDFTEFLTDLINRELEKVEIGFIAKIVTFDNEKMRATIKPMLQMKQPGGDDQFAPDIQGVPVELIYAGTGYVRPDYQKNDYVRCIAVASPITPPLDFDIRTNILTNRFSLSNCTVVQGVPPKSFSPPATFSKSGLLVGAGETVIQIDGDDVNIEGNVRITGGLEINGIDYETHTHTSAAPGSPTSPPTGGTPLI